MQKKYFSIMALAASCAILATSAQAQTIINDNTDVLRGHSLSLTLGFPSVDVIGNPAVFNTQRVSVDTAGSTLKFKLSTNMPTSHSMTTGGTTYNMYRGDFFIDTNYDLTPDYGVVLSNHGSRSAGTPYASVTSFGSKTPGLYKVVSTLTSTDFYEEVNSPSYDPMGMPSGGIEFGEFYYDFSTDNLGTFMGALPPVAILDGDLLAPLSISEEITGGTDPNYILSFDFDSSLIGGLNPFYVLWSSDTSTGDMLAGNAPVPEPGTMLLMGTGLAGLLGYGRKKKAAAAA